jgi:hypothetical protein
MLKVGFAKIVILIILSLIQPLASVATTFSVCVPLVLQVIVTAFAEGEDNNVPPEGTLHV